MAIALVGFEDWGVRAFSGLSVGQALFEYLRFPAESPSPRAVAFTTAVLTPSATLLLWRVWGNGAFL